MTAFDFPITQPYGYDPTYPVNGGWHLGVDYGCPSGTPIVVNDVQIGISGATGEVMGPHMHVGRWVGGKSTQIGPQDGRNVNKAYISEIGEDDINGKYVRLTDADGSSWVYLHMSNNKLLPLDTYLTDASKFNSKEKDETVNTGDIDNVAADFGLSPEAFNKAKNWNDLYYNAIRPRLKELRETAVDRDVQAKAAGTRLEERDKIAEALELPDNSTIDQILKKIKE